MERARLHGLDIARFLAFVGMVIVNFRVVMGAEGGAFDLLNGKAAASFVILAGLGIGLSRAAPTLMWRRAGFLFVLGMINAMIFPADIIHFYAIYFALAAFVLNWSARALLWLAAAVVILGAAAVITLDYDAGWDWKTLDYHDFWTAGGFLRNLFLNGWHPVFPWIGFLFIGMAFARMQLQSGMVQGTMFFGGLLLLLNASLLSGFIIRASGDAELAQILGTAPIPPMPLFMAAGTGAGMMLIGGCLWLAPKMGAITAALTAPGRQTLTLYVAHIVIGMGAMEALGLIGAGTHKQALIWSGAFCFASLIFANIWARRFGIGPLEYLMRRSTGTGNNSRKAL